MTPILGGLLAACLFATATLCSSRSSRLIPPSSVLAWVMLVGLVVTVPTVGLAAAPVGVGAAEVGWLVVAGSGNVAGLLLAYSALRLGKVSIVAPVLSTEGAVAAVISVATGESIETASACLLLLIVVGVVLAAAAPDAIVTAPGSRLRPFVLAALAAGAFGTSLYATGHVSASLPLPWVILPARLIGVVGVTLPLLAAGRLRLTRRAAPLVVAGGLCEVLGFGAYALGARDGLAVAAVLASQFAGIAAISAFAFFRERLTRLQLSGVAIVAVGVALLSAVRA
ncbi:MAG TPA: EamA family transporter [Jatrophihabitantaceae bacterium]|nr:EamA family transporter [Jatrophihabitantaceae bacterium]